MKYVRLASLTVAALVIMTSTAMAADPWNYVDDYAPIMQFNTLIVDAYPTGFRGEYSGYCTYVNIKSGYSGHTFQYWFYYRYDIRLTRSVDQTLEDLLQEVNRQSINLPGFEHEIDKLSHDHDWELVEIHVDQLGSNPYKISYYSHGSRYDLSPTGWPFAAPMQGKHCVVKVISDMHGSYPAGYWSPALALWGSWAANLEFAIAATWEHLAGYVPEVGYAPPYKTIDFTNRCRRFTSSMTRVHSLSNYPYQLPWDKGFNY